jgi:hypothetical protein
MFNDLTLHGCRIQLDVTLHSMVVAACNKALSQQAQIVNQKLIDDFFLKFPVNKLVHAANESDETDSPTSSGGSSPPSPSSLSSSPQPHAAALSSTNHADVSTTSSMSFKFNQGHFESSGSCSTNAPLQSARASTLPPSPPRIPPPPLLNGSLAKETVGWTSSPIQLKHTWSGDGSDMGGNEKSAEFADNPSTLLTFHQKKDWWTSSFHTTELSFNAQEKHHVFLGDKPTPYINNNNGSAQQHSINNIGSSQQCNNNGSLKKSNNNVHHNDEGDTHRITANTSPSFAPIPSSPSQGIELDVRPSSSFAYDSEWKTFPPSSIPVAQKVAANPAIPAVPIAAIAAPPPVVPMALQASLRFGAPPFYMETVPKPSEDVLDDDDGPIPEVINGFLAELGIDDDGVK